MLRWSCAARGRDGRVTSLCGVVNTAPLLTTPDRFFQHHTTHLEEETTNSMCDQHELRVVLLVRLQGRDELCCSPAAALLAAA